MNVGQLREWARALKRDVLALRLAASDSRVSPGAKLLALLVAAYALSPIDLIPDFIPVLGLLDDLLLVPAGIWLVLRLIDPQVIAELRQRGAAMERPRSWAGAALVVALWLAGIAVAVRLLAPKV